LNDQVDAQVGDADRASQGAQVFEFRVGSSRKVVAELFGPGIETFEKEYVEDPDTGTLFIRTGGRGRDVIGGTYALRWQGRAIGLEYHVVRRDDEHGNHFLFLLSELGTSEWALMNSRTPKVELDATDADAAMRVAAEACVVYESYLDLFGPHPRVSEPDGSGRELSPSHFGYGRITPASWGAR
jgi:hypothetical protein